jgi:hypothetical protein
MNDLIFFFKGGYVWTYQKKMFEASDVKDSVGSVPLVPHLQINSESE